MWMRKGSGSGGRSDVYIPAERLVRSGDRAGGAVNLGRKDPASIVLRLEADKSQRNPANDRPLKVENQSLLQLALC